MGGHDLTTPVTRVLVATAVMAVATVLTVNVSGATSGVALLGRVTLAVVVGALAFAGTTVVLAGREARRVHGSPMTGGVSPPEPPDPPSPPDGAGGPPTAEGPMDRRGRAARPSIRLVEPPEEALPADRDEAGAAAGRSDGPPSPFPFRGRLGGGSEEVPVRHLRPVPGGRGESPAGAPGGGRTAGGVPAEEAEGVAPPDDEEELHGPYPGGNR